MPEEWGVHAQGNKLTLGTPPIDPWVLTKCKNQSDYLLFILSRYLQTSNPYNVSPPLIYEACSHI
jgi:hypothetical protein